MNRFFSFLAISSAILFSGPAMALDPVKILTLQVTLGDHGFPDIEPSGKIGRATREAISRFAEVYSAPTDPDDLYKFMLNRSRSSSTAIDDEHEIEQIAEAMARKLGVHSQIYVERVRKVTTPRGITLCGYVAVGDGSFRAFQALRLGDNILIRSVDESSTPNIAKYLCDLSFPAISY